MVDFFWDRLHRIPQSVLFLPREEDEGGQGPVHLASRAATFRLFVQRYPAGPPELVWRDVASCVLALANGLGWDTTVFNEPTFVDLTTLPPFFIGFLDHGHFLFFKDCVGF